MSIACGIAKCSDELQASAHDLTTKKSYRLSPANISIYEMVDILINLYGNKIKIIVISNDCTLNSNEQEDLKKSFEEYANLMYFATQEELDFTNYLTLDVQYAVDEWILAFYETGKVSLSQCVAIICTLFLLCDEKEKTDEMVSISSF